jgi:hypothetical protein
MSNDRTNPGNAPAVLDKPLQSFMINTGAGCVQQSTA